MVSVSMNTNANLSDEVRWESSSVDNEDDIYRRELTRLFRLLRSQAVSNAEYFRPGATSGGAVERMYRCCSQLIDHLDGGVVAGVDALLLAAPMFDYSRSQPGSGYRSMVSVVHKCCLHLLTLVRYVGVTRESYLFRAEYYSCELEAYVTVLGQLRACLYYLQKLVCYCMDGQLFPNEDHLTPEEYHTAEYLMKEVEALSQEAFYGRCLGFQFCSSMVRPLVTINLVMASYSDVYCRSSRLLKLATSVLSSRKYYMNPDLRAKQVVCMTRSDDIQFCKGFWALSENGFMHRMPLYMCPSVAVDKVLVIGPESFSLSLADGYGEVRILPPSAHSGVGPVTTRLLSAQFRSGQAIWFQNRQSQPSTAASQSLIIHCHGGGFVAQSSASHQVYLRHWANDLDVPILCVDYSLAPESKFPRQLEEIYYAYCWAVKNCHLLGWTGERVAIVGDSAGANLAVAVALKAAAEGIRQPDGILSIYGCLLIHYVPSPSRILALMDPLLPLGVLSLCLHAYAGDSEADISAEEERCSEFLNFTYSSRKLNTDAANPVTDSGNVNCNRETAPVCDNSASAAAAGSAASPVVCPSGESDNSSSTKTTIAAGAGGHHNEQHWHKHLSVFKSQSTPVFHSHSTELPAADISVDAELLYLSTFAKIQRFPTSPLDNFKQGRIGKSPYMSPMLASDELLQQLCPVHLIACHLDPMLDDSVTFARRLRDINAPVKLEFISDLPHGFLNFVLVSQEAKSASDRCVAALKKLLAVQ